MRITRDLSRREKFRNLFKKDWKIVEKRKGFFIVSGVIFLVGLLVMSIWGFNVGMDFAGGNAISVRPFYFGEAEYNTVRRQVIDAVEATADEDGIPFGIRVSDTLFQESEERGNSILVRYMDIRFTREQRDSGLTMEIVNEAVREQLILVFRDYENNPAAFDVQEAASVSAAMSAELVIFAILAIVFAAGMMLAYIAFRFDMKSGLSIIISLLHDALIMTIFIAIFRIPLNSNFIAAILTVIGYSTNNSIVLFDRVREYKKNPNFASLDNAQRINMSIRDVFMRSFNAFFTTFITIFLVAIIGVPTIRQFAFPIAIGLISSFYSAIFISPAVWLMLHNRADKKRAKKRALTGQPNKVVAQ
jgi:preprotein translocase subunit SecF